MDVVKDPVRVSHARGVDSVEGPTPESSRRLLNQLQTQPQVEAAPAETEEEEEEAKQEENEDTIEPMLCLLCDQAVGGGEVEGGPVPSACSCDGGVVHANCVVKKQSAAGFPEGPVHCPVCQGASESVREPEQHENLRSQENRRTHAPLRVVLPSQVGMSELVCGGCWDAGACVGLTAAVAARVCVENAQAESSGGVAKAQKVGARWVTLRARWVTLRARWVMLRGCWVTLRARWVTLRARGVTLRARWVTLRARWVTLRARWVSLRARGVTLRARWVT
jgi:hypothetical protein